MNKKFSTLVASLLLASSFGTVGAQTVSPYTMFKASQTSSTSVKTFKKEGAFQLSDGAGKVLAMVKEADGKYVLKMVSGDESVKLAETLWTIRWTTGDDTVKKYYFSFESAAYNMPLSFSTENAGKGSLTGDVNYEFPGKIATWEWQDGIDANAGFITAVALKYRYANPDSVMTLSKNAAGEVGVIKYAQAQGTSNALTLMPKALNPVVLTAADLNSMMYTQKVADLMKLTFNADVSKEAVANKWTDKYEAVAASGANEVNKAVQAVIEAAQAAAGKVNTPAGVAAVVRAIDMASYTAAQKAVVELAAKEAEKAADFAAAVTAVTAVGTTYTEAASDAAAPEADAKALQSKFTDAWVPVATEELFDQAVDKVTDPGSTTAGLADGYKALKPSPYNLTEAKIAAVAKNAEYIAASDAADEAVTTSGTFGDDVAGIAWGAITQTSVATIKNSFVAEIMKLTGSAAMKSEVADLANDESLGSNAQGDYEAYRAAVVAAFKEVYVDAATTATADASFSADILSEINKLTGFAAKAEYDDAVDAENLTSEAAGEIKAAFKALVTGSAYAVPTSEAIVAVVAPYTEAKGIADLNSTAAGAAKTAADGIDKTTVAAAVRAARLSGAIYNDMDDFDEALEALAGAASDAGEAGNASVATAIAAVNAAAPNQKKLYPAAYSGYVSLHVPNSTDPYTYLRVDTTFLTKGSGNKHLAFATGELNAALTNSNGSPVNVYVQHDFNARYNFQFTYYPTEDSLKINTPLEDEAVYIYKAAGFAHPMKDKKYADMTNAEIAESWDVHTVQVGPSSSTNMVPENIVKIVVLNDATKHREVTIGADEWIESSSVLVPSTTLNTRIGFNVRFPQSSAIPAGVYTVMYVSNDKENATSNGRFITYNWLWNDYQFMASVEDQNLNHIPAAQWIVTQAKGENLNSIVNRESDKALVYKNNFQDVQQQYMYATDTKGLYKTMQGDSLMFTKVADEFTTDKTLGYFIDEEKNTEAEDQLKIFSLKYLNNLNDDLFVGYDKDSILNVAKTENEDLIYFRLIRATDSLNYGAPEVKDIAKQLKRIPFYLQLETANKNIKDEDKLFITVGKDGKYKLINSTLTTAGKVDYANLSPFFLKEFKEADTHYYAIIEAEKNYDLNQVTGKLANNKISVKDYPSILVQENLEGENQPSLGWGGSVDGRTSTFALIEKDAPKYRRLGVTNAEDGLTNTGTNVAKINVTREDNRYLYENTTNKVAGYEADPTGINYLGALFNGADKAAMFIDTAYVRNETARPQYLLAVRPDFTPDTVFCPVDHGHPHELVAQVRASYLVTLSDSVAAYAGNKPMLDKFMYENRTYTRLAFVDAIHQGDTLLITSSKFKGTENAKNDTIDLSKNGFNNAAVQFRLTKNDDQTAEFYIETQQNEFVRLINGVAVLTEDIADAERFNIAKTDDKPVANEGVNTSEVKVVAGNGVVTISGAQGKKVAISNILGQTIANIVVSSDKAEISAPAGVVVVAVEGEAAVKAIVK